MQYIDKNVKIIASNESDGETMKGDVESLGGTVDKVLVWDGPVPENSFTYYAPGIRMATAEYYFLRNANWLPFGKAVYFANELIGKYRSALTEGRSDDDYDFLRFPRTDRAYITEYLNQVEDTPEGKRALEVLDCAMDTCVNPISNYVATMLTLPAEHGGYGLSKPELGAVYNRMNGGFMPDASGRFLAYDLFWKENGVAVQYAERRPSDLDKVALRVNNTEVHFLLKNDISRPDFIDKLATKIAHLLSEELPEKTDEWVKAHNELLASIEVPMYDNMESTYMSISKHCR